MANIFLYNSILINGFAHIILFYIFQIYESFLVTIMFLGILAGLLNHGYTHILYRIIDWITLSSCIIIYWYYIQYILCKKVLLLNILLIIPIFFFSISKLYRNLTNINNISNYLHSLSHMSCTILNICLLYFLSEC